MKRAEVLDSAKKCVCGGREHDHGTPENNFTMIANLWSAYTGQQFTAKDVAMMMALLKVARIKTGKAEDSYVDLAGYAACACEIESESEKQKGPEYFKRAISEDLRQELVKEIHGILVRKSGDNKEE